MSKPLELKVYPHWEHNEICYANVDGLDSPINVDYWIACKRLDDAELMAEAYRQMTRAIAESGMVTDDSRIAPGDAATFGPVRRETSRLGDLHRFASLPHYDEPRP